MSGQIVRYQKPDEVLQQLTVLQPSERALIAAALNPKLSEIEYLPAVEKIVTILTTVYTLSGQKPDAVTLAIYAQEFYTQLMRLYSSITLEEVAEALRRGVFDEYGEYYGLNIKTFVQFVKGYLNSLERKNAKEIFEKKIAEQQTKELTVEERELAQQRFINVLYEDYLRDKFNPDLVPAFLYYVLEKSGKIALTREQKVALMQSAEKKYYEQIELQKSREYMVIKDVSRKYIDSDQARKEKIKNIARRLAMSAFFEQQRLEGVTKIFDVDEQQ